MHTSAMTHLMKNDPFLGPIIQQWGSPALYKHQNYYQELVRSIIGQQLSLSAAASITSRFISLYDNTFPLPHQIVATSIADLRDSGLSNAKANCIRDLAQHIIDGTISFDQLDSLSNEQIMERLVSIKGIGEWTVHMFLIFCMGRPDVLAHGDLGIKNGIKKLYGFDRQPTRDDIAHIADKYQWHPYESIACWYVWRSLEKTSSL